MTGLLRRLREQSGLIRMGALLIPLSIAPLLAVTPAVRTQYHSFLASFQPREPLAAPALRLDPVEVSKWRPLPEYQGAVPVLLYHGINGHGDHYSVTRNQFAEQMAMLKRANFRTITADEYVRFLHGDSSTLPIRPILITFDDGRWDSYAGADAVLARYGYSAVMSVIAGRVGHGDFYLDWNDLRRMRASGRWDIELEAGLGAGNIRSGSKGDEGPFYANLRVSSKGRETFAAYKRRVTSDVQLGLSLLRSQLPGWQPHLMAPPFGDYGQLQSNDPRLGPFMRDWLLARFQLLFVQGQPVFSIARTQDVARYQVISRTSTDQLYAWLRHGLSYSAWTRHEQHAQVAVVTQPLRDLLSRQLASCARLHGGRRAYTSCQRRASVTRGQLNTKLEELRLAAHGIAIEFTPSGARVAVGKVRMNARRGR